MLFFEFFKALGILISTIILIYPRINACNIDIDIDIDELIMVGLCIVKVRISDLKLVKPETSFNKF